MINVIIVARYPTVRAGLTSVLQSEDDFSLLAEAADLERIPRLLDELFPDILLIDLVDESSDALSVITDLAAGNSLPPMVILFDSATDAMEGMGLPGTSLLLRDATPEEIQASLRAASTGLITFDQRIARVIADEFATSPGTTDAQNPVILTPRELDVLHGIARGLPNKSIARELSISDHTVKFHITSIFQKLDVSSRSEAIAIAVRARILDL